MKSLNTYYLTTLPLNPLPLTEGILDPVSWRFAFDDKPIVSVGIRPRTSIRFLKTCTLMPKFWSSDRILLWIISERSKPVTFSAEDAKIRDVYVF